MKKLNDYSFMTKRMFVSKITFVISCIQMVMVMLDKVIYEYSGLNFVGVPSALGVFTIITLVYINFKLNTKAVLHEENPDLLLNKVVFILSFGLFLPIGDKEEHQVTKQK